MEMNMKMIQNAAVISSLALFGLVLAAMAPSPAKAETASHPAAYCMEYGESEMECDFATLSQCRQAASGLQGECYVNYSGLDDSLAYAPRVRG